MTTTIRTHLYGQKALERKALLEAVAAKDKEAFERWDDPAWRKLMAAEITRTIYEGFTHENLLELMAEVERVGEGDRITMREVRGLEVFWVSRGGTIDQSTIDAEEWELREDFIGFHVSEMEDKIRAGFTENAAGLADLAIRQMDAEINLRLLRLYQTGIPLGSDYYVGTPGLTLTVINDAIRDVQDETMDDMPAIIGRSSMTNQILDEIQNSGFFTPETNEQILRLGVLGTYRGCRIIKLRNYKDARKRPFFPKNELYVAGRDAVLFGFWGGLITKEWTEQGGWYWHNLGRRTCGGVLHHPERVRRIVDTSITP